MQIINIITRLGLFFDTLKPCIDTLPDVCLSAFNIVSIMYVLCILHYPYQWRKGVHYCYNIALRDASKMLRATALTMDTRSNNLRHNSTTAYYNNGYAERQLTS